MLAAVGLQVVSVVVLMVAALLFSGWESARFVMVGGAVAIIPNGLFALRLCLHRNRAPESYPVVFLLGEFLKVGFTIALLFAVVKTIPDLRWGPLLLGLIVALKAPLFALAFVRSAPDEQGHEQGQSALGRENEQSAQVRGLRPAPGRQGRALAASRPQ